MRYAAAPATVAVLREHRQEAILAERGRGAAAMPGQKEQHP